MTRRNWTTVLWVMATALAGAMLMVAPVGADGPSSEDHSGAETPGGPSYAGTWVPEGDAEACALARGGAAEGDFMVLTPDQLISGAEFGCKMLNVSRIGPSAFYLELECGGSNRHFAGRRDASIVVETSDLISFSFDGADPMRFEKCSP